MSSESKVKDNAATSENCFLEAKNLAFSSIVVVVIQNSFFNPGKVLSVAYNVRDRHSPRTKEMRIIDDFPLPIKSVTDGEKRALESKLRVPNRILKEYHGFAKEAGFRGDRRSFYAGLCRGSSTLTIPEADLKEILSTKNLEPDFLAIYSGMIVSSSLKWAARLDRSFSKDDICSFAVEGFLRAFCSYTNEERFSTYLSFCLERQIARKIASSGLMRIPKSVRKIKAKAFGIMAKEGVSFNSAMESAEPKKRINPSMVYISLEDTQDRNSGNFPSEFPEFSGLDRIVFDEFMGSACEVNLSELARRTLNPATGKPYSKMAMSQAWRRVRDRIAKEYSDAA